MGSCLNSPHHHTLQRSLFISSLLCGALLLVGIFFPHNAQAQYGARLTEGGRYENCTVTTSPNGKTTFKFRAQLKAASFLMAESNRTFATWGAAVFFFDRNGSLKPTPLGISAKMNQVSSSSNFYYQFYPNIRIYSGPVIADTVPAYANNWHKLNAGPVELEIIVNSSDLAEFPVIAVSMALSNTQSGSYMDSKSAYLSENGSGDEVCQQGNTGVTPPPPKKKLLTVKVPDWDFGELTANDPNQDIPLSGKFCLQYDPTTIQGERLQLSVSSQNGTIGHTPLMFKLVHRDDPSAVIPYAMRLTGRGLIGAAYRLPNNGPGAFWAADLNPSGESCFNATYTTKTTTSSKPGSYMDVLTFTVANPS